MSTRTITLEFNEEFFTLLEGLAKSGGHKSAQDYAEILISLSIFDALDCCAIDDYCEDYTSLDFDDGIPF